MIGHQGAVMRTFDHLQVAYVDASADPRLTGIARGLGLLIETAEDDDLPGELHDLVGQLTLRDDWDGPDRGTDRPGSDLARGPCRQSVRAGITPL